MENASKALLISGGILVAMLVISIGVYLFASYSDVGSSYEQTMEATEIQKFNVNFTKFEGRTDITIHEIVTLVNFAKQYQEQTGINIEITAQGAIPGNPELVNWLNNPSVTKDENEKIIDDLIKNNIEKIFTCTNINDENNDGKIDEIYFRNI